MENRGKLSTKPLSLMSRGERMLMLAVNHNVRATNSGPTPTSAAATAPLHRHGFNGSSNTVTAAVESHNKPRTLPPQNAAELSTFCNQDTA